MCRVLIIILFLPLSCVLVFGQTSFKGLTPGQSTRAEVEQALGQPTSQISERLFEYSKDGRVMYVQYSKNSPTAIRIQIVYSPPRERSEVLAAEGLPKVADTRRTNKQGALEEYFSYPKYVVITYQGNSQTQVRQVGYYSREVFEVSTPELPKTSSPAPARSATHASVSRVSDIPLLNANVVSLRFYESGADALGWDQREYKNRFSKEVTRGIYWALDLELPDPGRTINYTVERVVYRDGAFYNKGKCDLSIDAGFITSQTTIISPSCGFGWVVPGKWRAASYLMELFIDGRKVAAGSFEIY